MEVIYAAARAGAGRLAATQDNQLAIGQAVLLDLEQVGR